MIILKFLIIFALILFPFGEMFRFQIGNHLAIKPLDVVVGLMAVWWIFLFLKKNQKSKIKNQNYRAKLKNLNEHNFLLPLVVFSCIGFGSLVINLTWLKPSEFFVSFLYLLRFLSYALLFPIVLTFDKQFKNMIMKFLFVDGLIVVIVGFLQYFFYNNLGNLFYLGWDEHMHRIFSTFFDPNFAGAFFVLYLIFVGGLLTQYKTISIKYTALLSVVFLLTLFAIFLTFSRAALLALIIGSITFLWLINKKRLIIVVFAVILLFVVSISPKFYDENMNLFREASSKARLANYEVALRVIQDHPILGIGLNSYRYTKSLYGLQSDWVNAPSHADAGVDNSYLFVLATTGIVGFVVYGWLWVTILKNAFVSHRKKFHMGAIIVIASAFALFINAIFINSLFFASLMLWIWMMVGLHLED